MSNTRLGDVASLITKGTTPTTVGGAFTSCGINFIKSESIADSKYLNSDIFEKIDEETDCKLKRSRLKADDLLFSIAGAYLGKVAIVRSTDVPANTNQAVGIVRLKHDVVDKDYAYYFYSQKSITAYINTLSSQSSQPNLNLDLLGKLPFDLKPLVDQKKIAAALSALDAKIDCNNRINAELEAMAKLLYDYWFVQFDFPDVNGKPYKSSGGKMIYNNTLKLEIPEGWEALQLEDVISRSGTGLNPRENFQLGNGSNYYVTIKNVTNGRITLDDKCDKIDDEALKIIDRRSQLQVGDVLFTSIEPVGVTYLIQEKPENWNINESVFTLRPNYKRTSSEHLFCLLSSSEMKMFTKNSSTGSIHKGIRHGVLKTYPLAYGGKELVDRFSVAVKPVFKQIDVLEKESQQLAQLRDWLLPLLMNGQVRVA
jgi:type I restriction enzyme S subunit